MQSDPQVSKDNETCDELWGIDDPDIAQAVRRKAIRKGRSLRRAFGVFFLILILSVAITPFDVWAQRSSSFIVREFAGVISAFVLMSIYFRYYRRALRDALPETLRESGRCTHCGYKIDLEISERCPECGRCLE